MGQPEQKRIRMLVSMGGEGFNWSVGDEVLVEDSHAIVLCTEPVDSPRAEPVGWEISEEHRKAAEERHRRQTATQPRSGSKQQRRRATATA